MGKKEFMPEATDALVDSPTAQQPVDATTILDNVVRLDQMLDEGSRRQLAELPFLELSKHLKIKKPDR